MTGGDVAPLGKEGVTELHKLFKWASRSSRGLLLFIDEAEAFLGTRSGQLSEALRNAVSALLYHTGTSLYFSLPLPLSLSLFFFFVLARTQQQQPHVGTQQMTFMLVLATNRPGDLDAAVLDRVDEALEFNVPDLAERKKLLIYYFNLCIRKHSKVPTRFQRIKRQIFGGAAHIKLHKDLTDEVVVSLADKTEKFSGREISKMMMAVQAAVYGTDECSLDAKSFKSIVDELIKDQRKKWNLLYKKTAWS